MGILGPILGQLDHFGLKLGHSDCQNIKFESVTLPDQVIHWNNVFYISSKNVMAFRSYYWFSEKYILISPKKVAISWQKLMCSSPIKRVWCLLALTLVSKWWQRTSSAFTLNLETFPIITKTQQKIFIGFCFLNRTTQPLSQKNFHITKTLKHILLVFCRLSL